MDNSVKAVAGVTPGEGMGKTGVGANSAPRSTRAAEDPQSTSLSDQLQAVESRLASTEVVDQARVDAIKQAITEGRLQINPEAIADKLLESARSIIQAGKVS